MSYDRKLINRMKRVEGQVRGLVKMMEEDQSCRDVVMQMSAVRNAIDKTTALVVRENLQQCLIESKEDEEAKDEAIDEAIELLLKSRK
ncbi:DNA-binding transcriptional regulator, FrmR family [Pelagirhabdus alkalitolerans]|uniref:DNA-binding transcriptional regulator, FrmR family n=1 Tax=Pelagirhabdus alkalitolerans TaxID=1612202 RepID=A0A1G6KLX5_9BACI|nr:metal-sensitive transcriptional regulator [Pelagirhabdus alkalitolerans]SDC31963.1 DNA-binding transcriptional regulator, FrmR family [Pelagirhabdus alkalitolerans]